MDGVWIVGDTEGVFERVAEFDGVVERVLVLVVVIDAVLVDVPVAVRDTAATPATRRAVTARCAPRISTAELPCALRNAECERRHEKLEQCLTC